MANTDTARSTWWHSLASRSLHSLPTPVRMPLRRLINGARRRRSARRTVALLEAAKSPILIFQMGKVGSSTVLQTLRAADGVGPVMHLHHLTDLEYERRRHLDQQVFPLPDHILIAERLRPVLPNRHFHVVSGVRDPIARFLSGIFQTPMGGYENRGHRYLGLPDQMGAWRRSIDPASIVEWATAQLARGYVGDYFDWFNQRLEPAFGIDVMEHPFDREAGYTIIRNDRADLLIMQAERLSHLIPTVLSDFVGTQLVEVPSNIRADDAHGASTYREALKRVRLDGATCELIYSHPLVKHLYDDATIQQFTRRWTGGGER